MKKNIENRGYDIFKKEGSKMWTCTVIDSYNSCTTNYFETKEQCMEQVYYVWENEDWFNNVDKDELLANAIQECVRKDEERGVEPSLD